jgi:hypothetical protein
MSRFLKTEFLVYYLEVMKIVLIFAVFNEISMRIQYMRDLHLEFFENWLYVDEEKIV